MSRVAAGTIAGCFALSAFAVAIVAGLSTGNAAASVLFRALVAMVICYPIGLMIGLVVQRLVHDHVEAHREANPAPEFEMREAGDVDEHGEPTDEEVIVV